MRQLLAPLATEIQSAPPGQAGSGSLCETWPENGRRCYLQSFRTHDAEMSACYVFQNAYDKVRKCWILYRHRDLATCNLN